MDEEEVLEGRVMYRGSRWDPEVGLLTLSRNVRDIVDEG